MLLNEIDLNDGAFWTRPLEERQAAFATLRREDPLRYFDLPQIEGFDIGPGYYAVTRYADVVEISRNPEVFCSGKGSTSMLDMPAEMLEFFGSFIVMDDPKHARQRGIVSRRFTPKQLQSVLDNVAVTADALIDEIAGRGEVDLVETISQPFPLLIICDMMGIPRSEFETVLQATNVILGGGDPEFFEGQDPLTAIMGAGMTLTNLMSELAAHKREHPADDLTTALVHADADEDMLAPHELGSFFILLAVAGNDTTRTGLSHGMHYLTQHPDQRRIWQDDLDGVTPTAVEEIVRYASPVVFMRRTLTRDATVGGRPLREGEKVIMFYGSANRDGEVFEDPDRFDVLRQPNPHIGFGGPGPHFCLGAHLARRELSVMFSKLLQRLPDIEAAGPPVLLEAAGTPLVTGIKRLPVKFTPVGG